MDRRIASDLIKVRRAVKRKYAALKADILETEAAQRKQFKPISQPLEELLSTIKSEQFQPKTEAPEELSASSVTPSRNQPHIKLRRSSIPIRPTSITETPSRRGAVATRAPLFLETSTISETSPARSSVSVFHDDEDRLLEQSYVEAAKTLNDMMRPEVLDSYLEHYKGLARRYVEEMIRDTDDRFDLKYGVRFDLETDKFRVGNKELDFDGEDILIKDGSNTFRYRGTPGLYELLFKKEPSRYTKDDEKNYHDIVERTAAHRRNYDRNAQIEGNVGKKYKKIIQPLGKSKSTKKGGGLLNVNNKKIEYVPWKNPNTLVDRLRLLLQSQHAGHTGHRNEIISILEALEKAKVIGSVPPAIKAKL